MKRVLKVRLYRYIFIIGCFAGFQVVAGVVVIGNNNLAVNSITAKQAKKLWLGKKTRIDGAGNVTVVDSKGNTAAHKEFYKKIVKKKPGQLKAYWAKKTFTGKGFPPEVLEDDSAVIDWVSSNPNGLGYVDSSSVNNKVKVLLKD